VSHLLRDTSFEFAVVESFAFIATRILSYLLI